MTTDRSTKLLLGAIAAALWGLLLRPALAPVPIQAADPAPPRISMPDLQVITAPGEQYQVYLADDGYVFYFNSSLRLLSKTRYRQPDGKQ